MPDAEALEIVVSLKNLTEAGFRNLKGQVDSVDKKVQETSAHTSKFGSVLSGIGVGVGMGVFNVVTDGLSKLTGAFTGAIQGAMEDEAATTKLRQAMDNWGISLDKNSAAVAQSVKMGVSLGFTDADITNSMAMLVTATHDVGRAQQFQVAAMDLARLKGISLADATDAMTRVEGGQYRMLKTLGIQLPKNATAMDAYAAIEKAAGGQAEAFGETTQGAFARASATLDKFQADVGEALMPVLANLANTVSNEIVPMMVQAFGWLSVNVMPRLNAAIDWTVANVVPALGQAFSWIQINVIPALGQAFDWIGTNVIPALGVAFDWIQKNVIPPLGAVFDWLSKSVMPAVVDVFNYFAKNIMPTVRNVLQYIVQNVLPPFGTAINIIVKDVFPPLNAALSWIANVGLKEVETEFALLGDVVGPVVTAIVAGVQGITDALTRLNAALGNLKGAKTTAAGGVTYKMNQAGAGTGPAAPTTGSTGAGGTVTRLAAGALVKSRPGGTLALLAEAGENEWVIPQSRMGRASSGASTTLQFVFNTVFPPSPQMARELVDAVEPELGRRFALRGSAAFNGGF